MSSSNYVSTLRRDMVLLAYNMKKAENALRYEEKDDKATSEYIYPNQMEDAANIVNTFYVKKRRVISIQKKTKVGADGLMIELCKLMTTHIDDEFVVNPKNVRIITGMSNVGWEKDMIDKTPSCFQDKVFHHGKLARSDISDLKNGLIIIDEIDAGDKDFQVLHNTLKDAGMLDVKHMEENNNRFVLISATMIKELYDMYRWGELHELYRMTIPASYIGHKELLELDIVKEFYPLDIENNAEKWIQEDILDKYGSDYRIHIVRVNTKTTSFVHEACNAKGVTFRNHTSTDRMCEDQIKGLFNETLTNHIVIAVKGFFRRANLIPNCWKLRIGATHEFHTKKVDNNVQIQGLTGRMTGYWRDVIENGFVTGPHRTSIVAIREYEATYTDPFGVNSYKTAGFKKDQGKVNASSTMLSVKNIRNLEAVELPASEHDTDTNIRPDTYRVYDNEDTVRAVCKVLGYWYRRTSENADGFRQTALHAKACVASLREAIDNVRIGWGGKRNDKYTHRTCFPCYVNKDDINTLRFVVVIRPGTEKSKLEECDQAYPQVH